MKTSAWCTVLLACVLSRAALALYTADSRCSYECLRYGVSRHCACDDFPLPPLAPLFEAEDKRGGGRTLFRFGKRASFQPKRPHLPFRYGKRALSFSGPALSGYRSMRPR